MGEDKIRHLLCKRLARGEIAYFWNPSRTLRGLGLTAEALGTIEAAAKRRAVELNGLADEMRRGASKSGNSPTPGSLSRMISAFMASEDVAELKPRTRKDYGYYLNKVEM